MRIGIEAQRLFRIKKHGMDFVALEVIRQIQELDHENEYFIFVAPGSDECVAETGNMHVVILPCPTFPLWEQVALPNAIKKYKIDLLHCTGNTAPINCSVPVVLLLHDIIYLEPKPDANNVSLYQKFGRLYRRIIVPKVVKSASKIITVSHFEQERIMRYFNLNDDKVGVIYNACSNRFRRIQDGSDIAEKITKATDYIFALGNTDPKKNTVGILKAYGEYLQRSDVKRKLVLADISDKVLDKMLKQEGLNGIRGSIHNIGYISNNNLPYIYNAASTFLYVSLRESFGIPLLEAMSCGTPVITGDKSAMPEVAGDGAIMVDVNNSTKIADELIKLETNPVYHNAQVEYGIKRSQCFSWRATTEQYIKVYNDIIANIGLKR